jgi:hypothetical protein
MTQKEIAALKTQKFVMLGVGVVALISSFAIGYTGPSNRVSVLTEIVLASIFFGCVYVAGRISFKLNKEGASK